MILRSGLFLHGFVANIGAKVVDIRLMFNVNQPSEWDEDLIQESWEEYGFYPTDIFKGDDLNLKIVLETEKVIMVPDDLNFKF